MTILHEEIIPKLVPLDEAFAAQANVRADAYATRYAASIADPDTFWAAEAEAHVSWFQPWRQVSDCDFNEAKVNWFSGGELNVAHNCIDRHLSKSADKTAIIWEPDSPTEAARHITYRELHTRVSTLANVLTGLGVKKGDRVGIYMPMIPEAAYAMLACARLGAIHSVVFAGFSADALADRLDDAGIDVILTADEGRRGGKTVPLKKMVDAACQKASQPIRHVLVVRHTGGPIAWQERRDVWYHEAMATAEESCHPVPVEANHPLFILYTSGSTGKPKGVVHGTGGYLTYAVSTFKAVFDAKSDDIYWCTADVGWITGHSYSVYAPLAAGVTTVLFEGVPTWPDPSRFWQVVARHKVSLLYTAPTAIRALHAQGNKWVQQADRSSLRLLGSVGEPINPEAWAWYYEVVGESRCPIVDTWWQTETGGHMITPLPGAMALKPGAALRPYFGIQPVLVDGNGKELPDAGPDTGAQEGLLCIKASWPGQMQTVYGDHDRFKQTYFSTFKGLYFTGDGAKRDADGDWWITGRVDDVLNVSGHRLGTAEVESAIVLHEDVSEAAVVGYPHDIKGQGIYAYVTLNSGVAPSDTLKKEIIAIVREEIGPIASPDIIQWAPNLPKTRSGKIMRRILRKIAAGEFDTLGDTSTLADPDVVEELKANRAI